MAKNLHEILTEIKDTYKSIKYNISLYNYVEQYVINLYDHGRDLDGLKLLLSEALRRDISKVSEEKCTIFNAKTIIMFNLTGESRYSWIG